MSEKLQIAIFQDKVRDNSSNIGSPYGGPLKVLVVFWNPALTVNLSILLNENGIMRVEGRLQHLSAPLRTIHPVLLSDMTTALANGLSWCTPSCHAWMCKRHACACE